MLFWPETYNYIYIRLCFDHSLFISKCACVKIDVKGHETTTQEDNIFSLETVRIFYIYMDYLTLLNEFYTNQDISLNIKITFNKLTLQFKGNFDVIFISILTQNGDMQQD